MDVSVKRFTRVLVSIAATLSLSASGIGLATPASAQPAAPWDGNPISPGLGPTYGEEWCARPSRRATSTNSRMTPWR